MLPAVRQAFNTQKLEQLSQGKVEKILSLLPNVIAETTSVSSNQGKEEEESVLKKATRRVANMHDPLLPKNDKSNLILVSQG